MSADLKTSRPDQNNIALTAMIDLTVYDVPRLRQLYQWLVERFEMLEIPVTHLGVTGKRDYVSFPNARKRVEADDWSRFDNLTLLHFKSQRKGLNLAFHHTAEASLEAYNRRHFGLPSDSWLEGRWRSFWSIDPTDGGLNETEVLRELLEFMRLSAGEYGYCCWMRREQAPSFYASGGGASDGRKEDMAINAASWGRDKVHFKQRLLRDIYPYNFLSPDYLELPVYGTTLEQWVRADAGRGTLEPLTHKMSTWQPVIENIPVIREQLFRAGIMFYWRFYVSPTDTHLYLPGPRPFAPDEPIPEIFRAEFHAGHDPKITR